MSNHQRSQSFSTFSNHSDRLPSPPAEATSTSAPLSISIPRKRSMSISFGLPTSPLSYTGPSIVSNSNPHPLSPPPLSPPSATVSKPLDIASSAPTNITVLSSSIPSSLNRRFSSSFTNPLTNPYTNGSSNLTTGAQPEERGRRASLFGSSTMNKIEHPKMKENTGGGIGGLFRKFSQSGRSGAAASQHPFDSNEVGPLSNVPEMTHHNNNHNHGTTQPHTHDPKQDKSPRPSSPMRNMFLNGQMLD
ncbi:hypothetical protein BGZ46_000034 [Entomortierella lignicola]|nr:hypothetical protein BGZ46_000034 [Entomortierella lignicola]